MANGIARRLRLLAFACGNISPYEILGAVPDRLDAAGEMTRAMAAGGDEDMRRLINREATGKPSAPVPTLQDQLPGLLRTLARTDEMRAE